jgi:hypothetical protein
MEELLALRRYSAALETAVDQLGAIVGLPFGRDDAVAGRPWTRRWTPGRCDIGTAMPAILAPHLCRSYRYVDLTIRVSWSSGACAAAVDERLVGIDVGS